MTTLRSRISAHLREHANASVREMVAVLSINTHRVDCMVRLMERCGEIERVGRIRAPSGRLEYVYACGVPERHIIPLEPVPVPRPAPGRTAPPTQASIAAVAAGKASRTELELAWSRR